MRKKGRAWSLTHNFLLGKQKFLLALLKAIQKPSIIIKYSPRRALLLTDSSEGTITQSVTTLHVGVAPLIDEE